LSKKKKIVVKEVLMSEINEARWLMAELLLIWFGLMFVVGWVWHQIIEKKEPKNLRSKLK